MIKNCRKTDYFGQNTSVSIGAPHLSLVLRPGNISGYSITRDTRRTAVIRKRGKMRKAVLYIAMSLDGYIADRNGGVGWLEGDGSDCSHPGTYEAFYKTVDTIILGNKTYRQIAEELSPDKWIYEGKKSYVLTHHPPMSTEEVTFTARPIENLVRDLKNEKGKDIWICGGASVINQLLESDLIDRICITIIPVILGQGVPLFSEHEKSMKLKLKSVKSYNGMTDLIYEKR